MDYSIGGVNGSVDEDIDNLQDDGKRSSYKRLTSAQTFILENFMKDCRHPDEAQRRQLAEEVGLEPKQVKFWFQNKRTLMKNQNEREKNNTLRLENDKIQNDNVAMKEFLKTALCLDCGGPPYPEEYHQRFMREMQQENAQLKQESEKVSNLLARYMEKEISLPEFEQALYSIESFSRDRELEIPSNQTVYGSSSHVHAHGNLTMRGGMFVNNSTQNYDAQKIMMSQVAAIAMRELLRLVRVNEPFWVKSSNTQDGKYTLHHESYEQIFPKNNHLKGANVCHESSKYSGIVKLNGMELVDMFLDSVKWTNLFPTIVSNAETTKVFEVGSPGNRDGALLLMNEQMHILSPLVRPREFNIIRYCKQVAAGVWVITDVSFDSSRPNITPLSCCWKHPSGCIIREMPNGVCMVTWIEHVEVEDKIHTHQVYRDLIGNYNLYGAESWIKELQRMCERSISFYIETIPVEETIGVIQTLERRQSLMKLAHRMVKMFCECLTMKGFLEFQHLTFDSIGGVRVSLRKSTITGQPNGTLVAAATTLWLPLPAQKVFDFIKNPTKRSQWDVLSCGNPMYEVAHISNGPYPGNRISIIQSLFPSEKQIMILQESFTSPVGSYVIYAPTDRKSLEVALRGEDPIGLQILPYGFVVCSKSQPNATFEASNHIGSSSSAERLGAERLGPGTLLTLAFQILTSGPNPIDQELHMESLTKINTHLANTILKLKDALMRSG